MAEVAAPPPPAPGPGQPAYSQPAAPVYGGPGVNPDAPSKAAGAPSDKNRFDYAAGYRDPVFLGIFIVHLIIVVALTGAFGQKTVDLFNAVPSTGPAATPTAKSSWVNVLLPMVIVCAVVGVFFSFFWIWCMKRWGGLMIKASFALICALLLVNVIIGFALGVVGYSVYCMFVIAAVLIYFYYVKNRIPFTAAIMSASAHALQDFPNSIYIGYAFSVLQVGWFAFWVFAVISIIVGTRSLTGLGVFFMFLSYYWTSEIIRNISHTTTAGMVGSWWLQPTQPSPTMASFKRATTTSLGSIALGSLIVAAIQAANSTMRAMCSCGCYRFIYRYIERFVKYFNMYTFSYVAIYGQPFVPSARCTIALFQKHGFSAIVNDSLVGAVLFIGSLIGGGISALVALAWISGEQANGVGFYSPDIAGPGSGLYTFLYVICGFYAGMGMTTMSMTVFQSAVATTFVVWADDAAALSQHRPTQYKALADGAFTMYGASGPGYVGGAPVGSQAAGGAPAPYHQTQAHHDSRPVQHGGGEPQPAPAFSNPAYAPQAQVYVGVGVGAPGVPAPVVYVNVQPGLPHPSHPAPTPL